MAYVKIIFQNSPSTATPMNAQNLNHMDDQIALNDQRLTELEGAHVSSFNGRTGAVTPADGDYDIGQIAPLTGAQVGQVPVVTNIGTEEDPELVFRMGAGGGAGGHEILDADGTSMAQEDSLQFADSFVSDDSQNGRTVVENIKAVTQAQYPSQTEDGTYLITDGDGAVIEPASDDKVEVVADGVKTYQTLLNELYALVDTTKLGNNSYIFDGQQYLKFMTYVGWSDTIGGLCFGIVAGNNTYQDIVNMILHSTNSTYSRWENGTITPLSSYVPPQYQKFTLYYGNKKATVDLQTTANRCWMSDGVTSVNSALTYSPNERVVGEWDGKYLYRKIIKNSGTGQRNFSIGVEYTNIKRVEAFLHYGNFIVAPYYQGSGDNWNYYVQNSNVYFRGVGAMITNPSVITVIVDYVKV